MEEVATPPWKSRRPLSTRLRLSLQRFKACRGARSSVALTTRCLDCGTRPSGTRSPACTQRRNHVRNHAPAQRARLTISRQQRQRVSGRDGHRCIDCGNPRDLTLDHLVPLAVNVKTCYRDEELFTLCRSCNSSKGADR